MIGRLNRHHGTVWDVQFRPGDRDILASCSDDGMLMLWHVPTQRNLCTLEPFDGWGVRTLEFSPDGDRLVVAGEHETVAIYDLTHFDRHIEGNRGWQIRRRLRE